MNMQSTRYHYSSAQPEWLSGHSCMSVRVCLRVSIHLFMCLQQDIIRSSVAWHGLPLCTVCIVYAYTPCGRRFKMQMVEDGSSSSEKAHTGIRNILLSSHTKTYQQICLFSCAIIKSLLFITTKMSQSCQYYSTEHHNSEHWYSDRMQAFLTGYWVLPSTSSGISHLVRSCVIEL